MPKVQVRLAALWVALMFTYLLRDELRPYSGDVTPGELGGLSPEIFPTVWLASWSSCPSR